MWRPSWAGSSHPTRPWTPTATPTSILAEQVLEAETLRSTVRPHRRRSTLPRARDAGRGTTPRQLLDADAWPYMRQATPLRRLTAGPVTSRQPRWPAASAPTRNRAAASGGDGSRGGRPPPRSPGGRAGRMRIRGGPSACPPRWWRRWSVPDRLHDRRARLGPERPKLRRRRQLPGDVQPGRHLDRHPQHRLLGGGGPRRSTSWRDYEANRFVLVGVAIKVVVGWAGSSSCTGP